MSRLNGTVYSHTTIRVPGAKHADRGPFALVLVDLDDGRRVLGHLSGEEPPLPIGARVTTDIDAATLTFRAIEEQ